MKLNRGSYWLRSGTYSLLERLSFMLFGFANVYFLLRQLTKDDFGTWALFLTVTSVIEVGRNGLVQNALVKHLASSEKEEHNVINTASLVLNILLTCFSVLLLLILAAPLSNLWNAPPLEHMMFLYIATTILLIPISHCNFVQQANFDFSGNFWGSFTRQGSLFVYIVVCYFSHYQLNLIGLAAFQIVAAFLGAIVSWIFARKYLMFASLISWKWVNELFHFGKYVFGTNLSVMLYKNIDKWMLGSLLSTASVAVYDLAMRITNLIEVPTTSVAAVVYPQSAKKAQTEGFEAVKYLYERSVGIILAVIVPGVIIVWLFANPIIQFVGGDKYLETVPILRLTLLYGMFIPFSRQFGTVLDSIGKPKINFYFVVLSALMSIVFNYVFISKYGLIGAVYGNLLNFSIRLVLNQIVLFKVLKVRFFAAFVYSLNFYADAANILLKYLKKKLHLESSVL